MRQNSGATLIGFVGILVGLVLRLPLFPYSLPPDVANVMGAAFGAMFAVWGAAWVSDRKEKHANRLAVQAIRATVDPVIKRVRMIEEGLKNLPFLFQSDVDRESRIEAVRAVLRQAEAIPHVTIELEKRLEFLKPLFLQLGGTGAVAFTTLINTGDNLRGSVELIPWATFYDDKRAAEVGSEQFKARNEPIIDHAERALHLMQRFAQGELVGRRS